jgi:hypothetical protein
VIRALAGTVVGAALLVSCGETATTGPDPTRQTSAGALPQGDDPITPEAAQLRVTSTNPWFPMEPGTRWTYRETTEGGEVVEVVVTVTSATEEIASGGTARVVRDTVTRDGEVIEDTFDWYAEDGAGNVWYLGEDTAEFEDGRITTREGSFESGVDGALAGVIMPARPQVGASYRQEYYAGEAEDQGEVLALDARASVPAGTFEGLLQTADTNPLEPDVLEHKYYARDLGLVLTVDVGESGREVLVNTRHVSPAEARRAGRAPLGERY